ncbi:hypothetical protein L6452_44054 [Arctium lappa]|uniref:Uncharacterized protein n=1 Tax=Arctium lappa TaxID=4217 RepID=A0ACB8XFF1_ARCLA|nr:hypothetical protein L6452_44054 [Arctium lappa]
MPTSFFYCGTQNPNLFLGRLSHVTHTSRIYTTNNTSPIFIIISLEREISISNNYFTRCTSQHFKIKP